MNNQDLTFQEKISGMYLSKKERVICEYILEHYSNVIRMTARDIAEKLGISDITIIRLSKKLGYSGFRDMQRSLQRMEENGYGVNSRGPASMEAVAEDVADRSRFIDSTLRLAVKNMEAARELNSVETFCTAADAIFQSRKVYIAGFWKCMPLVKSLEIKLKYVCDSVVSICSYEPNDFIDIIGGDENDCLVLIAFHRFPKGVQRVLKLAMDQNLKVVILTEDPLVWSAYSQAIVLTAPRDGEYFSNMLGASYVSDVLAAMVSDSYMKSSQTLKNGKKRNKVIGSVVLDMDYFSEWPNLFFTDDDDMSDG